MNKEKDLKKLSVLGITLNLLLLVIKLIAGFLTGNHTMIADGVNSLGDVLTSILTFIGNKVSSVPKDKDHPYGHGKAEYIFSMIISFTLLIVAFSLFKDSLDSLINKETFIFSHILVLVAVATIVIKFFLYKYAKGLYEKYSSLLALANSQDHRNDIFITSLTFVSIITGYFHLFFIDSIGGIAISLWICYSAFKIFMNAYNVLMDKTIDEKMMLYYAKIINKIAGVDHVDEVTAKPVGITYILIVKVSVDGNMNVYKSHSIGARIKEKLLTEKKVTDVIVHINPTQEHPYKLELD